MPPEVSIIIVSHNTKDMLKNCLVSIIAHTADIEYEIILFDNGSTDGSQAMVKSDFPGVILIGNAENIGFGAANNRARSVARGKYVFFLNSDTVLLNNAVQIFYDFWESSPDKEGIGALGCNLLGADGNVTASHGKFFKFAPDFVHYIKIYTSLFLRLFGIKIRRQKIRKEFFGEVDIIVGAALFMKNNDDAAFDERFFLYHEEADLQYRLAQKGKKRLLVEGPKIIHLGNNSGIDNSFNHFRSLSKIHDFLSRIKYYRKHFGKHEVLLLKIVVFLIFAFPPLLPETKKHIMELIKI